MPGQGNQTLSLVFDEDSSTSNFNKQLAYITKPGVIEGLTISHISGDTIELSAGKLTVRTSTGEFVKITNTTTLQIDVSETEPYIVYKLDWLNDALNSGVFRKDSDDGNFNGSNIYANEIVIGKAIYVASVIDSFEYLDTTYATTRIVEDHVASSIEHGVTGNIVGNTDTQTISNKTITTPIINGDVSGTAVLDEDTLVSDSNIKLATQQSIKAYADNLRFNSLPKRQCILSGKIDANGYADFLSSSTGQVTLEGATTPALLTWANGYNVDGEVNYTKLISSDESPANWDFGAAPDDTYYLVINYSAGILTYDKINVLPEYGYNKGSFGTPDKNYYVIPEHKMYEDSGSAWVQKNNLIVGECTVVSGSVTSVTSYAIRGEYAIDWTAVPGTGSADSYTHNIGTEEVEITGKAKLATTGRILPFYFGFNGANVNFALNVFDLSELGIDIRQMGTTSPWYTGGDDNVLDTYKFYIKRSF